MKVDQISEVTKTYLQLKDKKRQERQDQIKYKRKGKETIIFDEVYKKKSEARP